MTHLRIGVVILPDLDWPEARERWLEAERIGFESAWTYDHLSWRTLRDGPWLGTVPLLAGVAACTTRIRIGTLVTSPNFRHPAVLAKDVMTLDRISGGRFDLGIGAGGQGWDATVLGAPAPSPSERAARFEEFVAALDALLRHPVADFAGDFFQAVGSRTVPGCVQLPRVPFTIAAAGVRAMKVAALHGQNWVTFGPLGAISGPDEWFAVLRDQYAKFATAVQILDRDVESYRRTVLINLDHAWPQESVAAFDEFCSEVSHIGFTDVVVHWPRPHDEALPGVPPDVFRVICEHLPGN